MDGFLVVIGLVVAGWLISDSLDRLAKCVWRVGDAIEKLAGEPGGSKEKETKETSTSPSATSSKDIGREEGAS